ncbi:MAG: ABC transporter ATP-binding protein [Litorilinea sp.]|nr:MAG: ABC transporter ATP-binding protein [Litorilinea sp.]
MTQRNSHTPLLDVENLTTHIFLQEGVVRAVDGVSFSIHQGQTLGIIGESGSGKSVTAQSIMRIVPSPPAKIVDGKVLLHVERGPGRYEVVNILELPDNGAQLRSIRWAEIAMVFQEPMSSFSPLHTIGDQIMEAILLHYPDVSKPEARERTIELLGRVGIPRPARLVDAYPHELSGGMRQRAMIAMALSCTPRLLIADEPTTALDVTIEAQILSLIADLQEEYGMAIMYISHDLAVVSEIADEIMVMYLGLVMEHADAETILRTPLHPYTQALWRSIPRIDGPLEPLVPISGSLPSPFAVRRGCPFYSRCEKRIPGVCNKAVPPLIEVEAGHTVRCVLYLDQGQVIESAKQGTEVMA